MPSPNATHSAASNVLAALPPPGRKYTAAAIASTIATLRAVFSESMPAGSVGQSLSVSRRAYASSTARVAAVWRASDLADS